LAPDVVSLMFEMLTITKTPRVIYIISMKCKPDWTQWLHGHKRREIEAVFKACPEHCFTYGLELGAGDGYQSTFLSRYIDRMACTEINPMALTRKSSETVEYRVCGAEDAARIFPEKSFDFIFSSNLLEHIARPVAMLTGVRRLLKEDGLTIHIIPSPFWKLCQMGLYIPAHVLVLLERITRNRGLLNCMREIRGLLREFVEGVRTGSNQTLTAAREAEMRTGNNPGIVRKKRSFLYSLILPAPHGVSETHWAEMRAFSRRRWIRIFDEAGLTCIAVRKGPAASGYGLGWEIARNIAKRAGLASEFIYIAHKKGCTCKYTRYFR